MRRRTKLSKQKRFSLLGPLSLKDMELVTWLMLDFFGSLSNKKMREFLGKEVYPKKTVPLSFGDFLSYYKKEHSVDAHRYTQSFHSLIRKLLDHGFLVNAGSSTGSPPYNQCYYSDREFTEAQKKGLFVFSEALGPNFIRYKYEKYIVRIEGALKSNNLIHGTGTGILIQKDIILTCKHNIDDLDEKHFFLGEKELSVKEYISHESKDISLVILEENITDIEVFPYFGYPFEMDNIVTLGYPPVQTSTDECPVMVSQKGEINGITHNWNSSKILVISSMVRPGNSGGPVVSNYGYIVGLVIQSVNPSTSYTSNIDTNSKLKQVNNPFYIAISSVDIFKFINLVIPNNKVVFEDYN